MNFSEGLSVTRPPYFDGSNYQYWKTKMKIFFKSLDENLWIVTRDGWKEPCDKDGNTLEYSKWSKNDKELNSANSKALNGLFCALSPDEYKRILSCETAKKAWDLLETTHEGTSTVKISKLQMLMTEFEIIKMEEDESFTEYYTRLNDIINGMWSLGEKMAENKIVRKILRSLTDKFEAKVTAIEENKNLDQIKLEELIGSLQTYELKKGLPKRRDIAFNVSRINNDFENDLKDLAIFARKFLKFFETDFNRNYCSQNTSNNSQNRSIIFRSNFSNNEKVQNDLHTFQKQNDYSRHEIKCYNCEGFGHIATNCASENRKAKMQAMQANLDEETNESDQSENNRGKKFNAFTSFITEFDSISINSDVSTDNAISIAADNIDDDCISENELKNAYDELYDEYIKLGKKNKVLLDEINNLTFELCMAKTNFENNEMLLHDLVIENKMFKFEIEKLKVIVPPLEKCCNFHYKKGNICDKNIYKISCMHCGKFGHHNYECIHKKRCMKTESCSKKKNYFKKGRNMHNLASCHYCGKMGHFNFECKLKRNTKMTWIPKTTYHG